MRHVNRCWTSWGQPCRVFLCKDVGEYNKNGVIEEKRPPKRGFCGLKQLIRGGHEESFRSTGDAWSSKLQTDTTPVRQLTCLNAQLANSQDGWAITVDNQFQRHC